MTFKRIRRWLLDKAKPDLVDSREIVLKWSDNPPSPCLQILIGHDLAREFGLRSTDEKVQLMLGEAEDSGKVAIHFVPGRHDGDYRCISQKWGYKVYLPAHVSVTHFDFCQRTTIPASRIELRGHMMVFDYRGLKIDPARSYRDVR